MPQPSSTTVEDGVRRAWRQRGLAWRAEIHSAKRGVIFQRTAPVVPPARDDDSSVGD